MGFDRDTFAELLDKARGHRSQRQYAKDSGVSYSHISRFLNKLNDAPPAAETIQKLASAAHNNVTYEDLMISAGFMNFPGNLPASEIVLNQAGYCNMSFLDEEIREWIKDPENVEFIKFIYKMNKSGISKEALGKAQVIINVNG